MEYDNYITENVLMLMQRTGNGFKPYRQTKQSSQSMYEMNNYITYCLPREEF